jgi:hypothetical protein
VEEHSGLIHTPQEGKGHIQPPQDCCAHECSKPQSPSRPRRAICGIDLITLLSTVICILSIAVIGLIAATAVEANKASKSTSPLPAASPATDTICSSGSPTYEALWGYNQNFTLYCNFDLTPSDLLGVTSPSLEACINTCADWNGRRNANVTENCTAVSFIPSWYNATGKVASRKGKNPGNCFLKHHVGDNNIVAPGKGLLVDSAVAIFF